ncbi:MAG TPA: 30S ribosomal protein S12 methylthiotransferase RimO [Acidiferrobacteraceae bacterium]|nr:30S ribosomal protein S12 methylthiotransferase RimO [Acidiferrobacteraceae bacterium]HEX19200.1 30S ribosomal protein S12 methylthiotransferase RimO [Acidiferrobacteraceae bacterium]
MSPGSPPKIGFVSLGCPKALVDSEHILNRLGAEGYDISEDYAGADLVVINTCGFIDAAIEESLDAIDGAMKENGKVIVTGCLGAKGNIVKEYFPEVLAVTGPHASDEVVQAIHRHLPPQRNSFTSLIPPQGIKLTPQHYAYLKISEGCNHRCSFCIIPDLRGDLVSRPANEVMAEAERLVQAGVKELLVISQDTSAYGVDRHYDTTLYHARAIRSRITDLSAALGDLGVWVRLHYVYPYPHVDELIPLMADGKILPYLDVPFQHASKKILKAMKRPGSHEQILRTIKHWRSVCPELTIRSTFIVGFPGESDADFKELLQFLESAELNRVGCFTYSDVEGAAANDLPGPVPEEVKLQRQQQLMELQADISAEKLASKMGQTMQVLVDEVNEDGAVARTRGDAPEIDGLVYIEDGQNLTVGEFYTITVTGAREHDMWGKIAI